MKTIKGFDKNLQCRGYQYEIGKTYQLPKGEKPMICNRGFHAISPDGSPLNVFSYYPPATSRYCEVEIDGVQERDDKICGSEIKVGAEIGILGIVLAHIEWVKKNLIDDEKHQSSNTGNRSSASNTGYRSSASNTGNYSSASNTGYRSSASNTGNSSSASNTGYCSSASNTGDCSSASNTGNYSSASNTGNSSSAEVSGKDSCAAAFGKNSKVRGAVGCALFIVERDEDYHIINAKAVIVDGDKIKADTWYMLVDGIVVEA